MRNSAPLLYFSEWRRDRELMAMFTPAFLWKRKRGQYLLEEHLHQTQMLTWQIMTCIAHEAKHNALFLRNFFSCTEQISLESCNNYIRLAILWPLWFFFRLHEQTNMSNFFAVTAQHCLTIFYCFLCIIQYHLLPKLFFVQQNAVVAEII